MRRLMLLLPLLALAFAAAPSWAEDAAPPVAAADKAAIHDVIQHQLDAFQKDDGAAAYSDATPELQERFGSVENFMNMVRDDYAPVYRPSQVTFGAVEQMDGQPVQHVMLLGADGNLHEALYFMERGAGGKWLIGGCLLLKTDLKSS